MAAGQSDERWRPPLPANTSLEPVLISAATQPNGRDCGIYALTGLHRLMKAILNTSLPVSSTRSAVEQVLSEAELWRDLQLPSNDARMWWAEKLLFASVQHDDTL